MIVKNVDCPACGWTIMVDEKLWSVGTVRLRCGGCEHYFLPVGSPGTTTIEEAANAAVPITIWEPESAG